MINMPKKQLALIWMSSGNSYFTEEIIGTLINFANENYPKIMVLSPDKPAEHNFRAVGYSENKVRKKAKLGANLLINRFKRQLLKIDAKDKFNFVNWETEVLNNSEYKKKYVELMSLYKNNLNFRKDARNITKDVITNKFKDIKIDIENTIDEAVLYLIEEFAFIFACPIIYDVDYIYYLYHHNWYIFENLISGKYDGKKRSNFKFILTGIK